MFRIHGPARGHHAFQSLPPELVQHVDVVQRAHHGAAAGLQDPARRDALKVRGKRVRLPLAAPRLPAQAADPIPFGDQADRFGVREGSHPDPHRRLSCHSLLRFM